MCQDVIKALEKCHEDNPKLKFLGACNDEKAALDKCFRVIYSCLLRRKNWRFTLVTVRTIECRLKNL